MAIADAWKRAANGAAAVHQIRNRLQSIIIEAALLKRTAGDPAALARIGALAQDGAAYLEIFGELLPKPDLEGAAHFDDLRHVFEETGVCAGNGVMGLGVRCHAGALEELLRTLLSKAIPYRGFMPKRLTLGSASGGRAEVLVELQAEPIESSNAAVTPWMTAQQMARDLGGSLELHSGEPPLVKLHLPAHP